MQNTNGIFPATLFAVLSLFFPEAKAVVPPPDGGYPGGNTAEGQNALLSVASGGYNTAVGFSSLSSDSAGSFNTAIGAGTLLLNTADQNTAAGAAALLSNTTGAFNTANGAFALFSNTTGTYNNAVGQNALKSNQTGQQNNALGAWALLNNVDGNFNTAIGDDALRQNVSGNLNTAIGEEALANTTGSVNTAIGAAALAQNTTGSGNIAIGYNALVNNIDGGYNIAIGYNTLTTNTHGSGNIVIGSNLGYQTGYSYDNITIGRGAPTGNAERNIIRIGNWDSMYAAYCLINGIWGAPSGGGLPVHVNSDGYLNTDTSSRRFKKQIRPMERASEAILALKPVTFQYKSDKTDRPQFGLIAEEVEKVNPDLVVRDKEGKPYGVLYDAVNAMLLNEFLKEHRRLEDLESRVAKQETIIAQQQKEMESVIADLKEQAVQIQKVSAQIEMNGPPRQVAITP